MPLRLFFMALFGIAWITLAGQSSRKAARPPGDALFSIGVNDRCGFINQRGEVVIEPVFRSVGSFVDGLAPARLNGTYGFIDTRGKFVIPPAYDYAADFSEGFARVWTGAQVSYIDRTGRPLGPLPGSILQAVDFSGGLGRFVGKLDSGMARLAVDRQGKVTELGNEDPFLEGLRVLTRYISTDKRTEYALEDSTGKLIVPFGRYARIENFSNGLAEVCIACTGANCRYGFIDRAGRLVFTLPPGSLVHENYFSEGLVAVYSDAASIENYVTWYDKTGAVQWVKDQDEWARPFKNGRAFAADADTWYLMDHRGRQVGPHRFDWISDDDDFTDNMVLVSREKNEEERFGFIDSMGNYVIPPQFDHVSDRGFQREGLLVAMNEPLRPRHGKPEYAPRKKIWGLIDRRGRYIIPPKFTQVSEAGYQHGLLYAEIDSLHGYVDARGRFVWSAVWEKQPSTLQPLNVDFMVECDHRAFASHTGRVMVEVDSSLMARPGALNLSLPAGELGIRVDTALPRIFQQENAGFTTYVYNTTGDTVEIDVQDNQLYVVMQALNRQGQWQDIEYMLSSSCGNSYYDIRLNPDEYWTLSIPRYEGDLPVTLRLAFHWKKIWKDSGPITQTIYSNTFQGSINPGQLWRK